jgi:UrcA family protein
MFNRYALALAATIAVAAGAEIADGAESSRVRVGSVTVAYGDLDLSSEADARVMLKRLEHAARRACGGNPQMHPAHSLMPRRVNQVYRECRAEAVARAVAHVNEPVLSVAFETVVNRAGGVT